MAKRKTRSARMREYTEYMLARGNAKAKFIPNERYQGAPIELSCGKFDAKGKFHPKNIKLTSIARLNKFEWPRDYNQQWDIYSEMMRRKDPTWTREAAESRWEAARIAYYAHVR